MLRTTVTVSFITAFSLFTAMSAQDPSTAKTTAMIPMSFYGLSAKTLDGEVLNFESLRGKRVLIVNTASECGHTPQYAQLQELYEMFGGDGFVILGFPSNDFGGQEPGSAGEIASFCQKNYGVTFQMMEKVEITGEDPHLVYKWLTRKTLNGMSDAQVTWNFNKFLIDEYGTWIAHYSSRVAPLDNPILTFARGN